jgi:hypothetical protein
VGDAILALCVRSANDVTPQRRLARLGEWLRDLAGLEPPEFVDAVTVAVLATRERELARIETMVASGSGCPAYWRQTLRAYRRELLKNLQLAEFPLPIEFHGASTRAKAWKTFQRFVGGSAELLTVGHRSANGKDHVRVILNSSDQYVAECSSRCKNRIMMSARPNLPKWIFLDDRPICSRPRQQR